MHAIMIFFLYTGVLILLIRSSAYVSCHQRAYLFWVA